ncbi:MAG TPA: right-handed parallel beta-helix repeat-containing protein [Anaerolineales bacterium]|nr:right-handed parallel beta-helix repeat-containing protein [Anaerolineales bacterium]
MQTRGFRYFLHSIATAALILIGVLSFTGAQVAQAAPGQLFVKPNGTGTLCTQAQSCALGTALGKALQGDSIYLAQGTYTGSGGAVVALAKSLSLYGGWDGVPTGAIKRDPKTYESILDGQDQRRVISISGAISPLIDGFTITRGRDSLGGGIYSSNASPVISNNVIKSNVALLNGGGIYTSLGSPLITANTITSNSAVYGGGLNSNDGDVTFHGNYVAGNQADYGGGLNVIRSTFTGTANRIVDNHGSSTWIVSGSQGGQMLAANNVLANNDGTAFTIYQYNADLIHNTIVANQSNAVNSAYAATVTLTNNILAGNQDQSIFTWANATVSGSHNLFWGNASDAFTGQHAVLADPKFVNSSQEDYHLRFGSPASDAGVLSTIHTDLDGRPRDDGRPDIGAYELKQWHRYLPFAGK